MVPRLPRPVQWCHFVVAEDRAERDNDHGSLMTDSHHLNPHTHATDLGNIPV